MAKLFQAVLLGSPGCFSSKFMRMVTKCATVRSASCSSLSHSISLTGSPSPKSDHSVFWNNLGLETMTLLAARKMALVER